MTTATLDFETYYDSKTYTLSKMTTQEYILDPRFEALLLTLKINDGVTEKAVGDAQIRDLLNSYPIHEYHMVGQNTVFDASIAAWRYGIWAKGYVDTMSMANSIGLNHLGSVSLASLSELMRRNGVNIPPKGNEVVNMNGKRMADMTQYDIETYMAYCVTDTENTYEVFRQLLPYVPAEELVFQDLILRCYIQPTFVLDEPLLHEELARVQARKLEVRQTMANMIGVLPDMLPSVARSGAKFAGLLRAMGGVTQEELSNGADGRFIIPQKKSEKTGKMGWAFAKTNNDFLALGEHPDPLIAATVDLKLSESSSTEETRCERFIRVAKTGFMAIPYKISGAHTHRLGGADKMNLQNLPSGRVAGQSTALRRSIMAPPGHKVIVSDSSQIEARVLAYTAGQDDLLQVFAEGGDPYSYMAAELYNEPADFIYQMAKVEKVAPYSTVYRPVGKEVVLGCGYGMGYLKFADRLLTQTGIAMSDAEAKGVVDTYRRKNHKIRAFWKVCDGILQALTMRQQGYFGGPNGDLLYYDGQRYLFGEWCPGIRLPDGMWLTYQGLELTSRDGKPNYRYFTYKGRARIDKWIYGGAMTENIIQALAFAIIKFQARLISTRYRVVLNTHDENATVVPDAQVEEAFAFVEQQMMTAPAWAHGLPLACESGIAERYGDA